MRSKVRRARCESRTPLICSSLVETVMGYHDNAIRCVHFSPETNLLITGSWDSTVKCWDSRVPNCLSTCSLPDKVYTLDSVGELLVVGTAQRKVLIWDLRSMSSGTPIENRESNLKYQTRCIRCFPNKQGYVLSSIEGSSLHSLW